MACAEHHMCFQRGGRERTAKIVSSYACINAATIMLDIDKRQVQCEQETSHISTNREGEDPQGRLKMSTSRTRSNLLRRCGAGINVSGVHREDDDGGQYSELDDDGRGENSLNTLHSTATCR